MHFALDYMTALRLTHLSCDPQTVRKDITLCLFLRPPCPLMTLRQDRADPDEFVAETAPTPMQGAADAPSAGARELTHKEISRVFIGVMLAMLLGSIDQTIIAPALPSIGRSLNDTENLSWVVTIYLVTGTAVVPLYGKLADIYGRRVVLMAGLVIFMVSSVAAALAPSMTMLIVARALQGVGGGGLISLVQTIVADVVSPRERGRYMGYFVTVSVGMSVGGPVIGGLLTQYIHWSMIFWINIPIGLAALWMSDRTLRRLPVYRRPHKLDIVGAALMMVASIVLLLALSWGGVRYPWFSAPIGALVAGSLVLWIVFAWRITTAMEPFLPLHTLRNPIVRNGILARGFAQGALAGLTIFLPLYFEVVRHVSVAQAGFALIPLMGGMVTAGQMAGRLCVIYDHYKIFPLISLPITMAVLLVFAAWPTQLPLWAMYGLLAVIGMGFGPLMPISTVMVQNAVPQTEMGITTSALNFARSFGGALFVALFGAILLGGAGGEGMSIATLMRTASSIEFGGIFRYVFLAAAAGVFVAIVLIAITEEVPLRRTPHLNG